jgi:N-acyl-D-amino-acid deacylase
MKTLRISNVANFTYLLVLAISALLCACSALPSGISTRGTDSREADLLLTNGRIVDGTGNSWIKGDVAIKGGRIIAVGNLSGSDGFKAKRTIDVKQQIIAPGFIDVHGHIEMGLLETPTADNYIHDGVTTVVTGNCGSSADDLKDFFTRVDREHTSINVASLVGHNTVRRQVMGLANRKATVDEQTKMEALVDAAMKQGAVGLSTGLIYLPGVYSDTPEVIGLAKAASKHHGIYSSHIRNEGSKVAEAINEALDVGRSANMPVQVSHFKVSAPVNWGRSKETLALIENARAAGLDVTIDQYPYTASSTGLSVMLPDWALADGDAAVKARLTEPTTRKKIAMEILKSANNAKRADFSYAVVARHATDAALNGKSIKAINVLKGRPDTMEAGVDTIIDLMIAGGAQMVYHGMSEDDVKFFMAYPFNMVGADGGVQNGKGQPHPRSYGTNARVLGKYVREEKVIRVEEAVRRMTSLAAQRFQLKDRGLIREGYAADIVVFNEITVRDNATFDNPHQFSSGFSTILVNGQIILDNGKHTGTKSGVSLRGPAFAQ